MEMSSAATRSRNPPRGPLLDRRNPSRTRSCRIFARKWRRNPGFSRDILHHRVFVRRKRRHVDEGANGVFGGARVDHEKNTILSENWWEYYREYHRSVMRKWLVAGAVVLFVAVGGVGLVLRAHKAKSAPIPVASSVVAEPTEANLTGRVQARTVVAVPAPVEGTLEAFFVDVNQEVYKDQLLGRIRNGNLDTAVQQAQSEIDKAQARATMLSGEQLAARLEASRAAADQSRARADVDRLEKAYQRQKGLWEAGATPRLAFEKAEKDYKDAQATIERTDAIAKHATDRAAAVENEIEAANRAVSDATASAEQAKVALATTEVHSPADGILVARRGQPGEPVDPSIKDLLQIAIDLTALQLTVTPEPTVLARMHAGQAASLRIPEISAEEIPATVREVGARDAILDFTSPAPVTKLDLAAQVKIKF